MSHRYALIYTIYLVVCFDIYNISTGCLYKLLPINLVWGPLKCSKSKFNPVHVFLHFKSFCLVVLKLILASKLSELQQFQNGAANYQLESIKGRNEAKKTMPLRSFRKGAESKLRLSCTKIETGSPFLHFSLGCSICQKIQFCSETGHLLPDFQIAITHSILKLKSILIPPDKMTWSGEKHVQD